MNINIKITLVICFLVFMVFGQPLLAQSKDNDCSTVERCKLTKVYYSYVWYPSDRFSCDYGIIMRFMLEDVPANVEKDKILQRVLRDDINITVEGREMLRVRESTIQLYYPRTVSDKVLCPELEYIAKKAAAFLNPKLPAAPEPYNYQVCGKDGTFKTAGARPSSW